MSKPKKKFWTDDEDAIILPHLSKGLLIDDISALVQPLLNRGHAAIGNRIGILRSQRKARKLAEAKKQTIKVIATGCHTCGADAIGKYCEAHARTGFPKDMSTNGLILTCGKFEQPKTRQKITMPKRRAIA